MGDNVERKLLSGPGPGVAGSNSAYNNNNVAGVRRQQSSQRMAETVGFLVGSDSAEYSSLDGSPVSGNSSNDFGGKDKSSNDVKFHPSNGLFRTFLNFLKANVGTGILAMPDAVKNAGLLLGSFGIIFVGFLATYCCHLLLRAYRRLSLDRPISYADVAELAFRRAYDPWARLGGSVRLFINTLLVVSQIGFCAVYVTFCSRMMKEVFEGYYEVEPRSIRVYETIVAILLVPFCFVTTLKTLALFTLVANALTGISLVLVMQHVFQNLQDIEKVQLLPSSSGTIPLFFGTAMFTFESINLILPIENRMKDRSMFHGWNGLLSMSMAFVVSLYVLVGVFGFMAFGEESQMILTNMPKSSGLFSAVKLMYGVSIFISYNLQLYVPVQIVLPPISEKLSNQHWFKNSGEYLLRTILIFLTYCCAVFIPCLELMISLFGAFAASWLALILPPVIEQVSCLDPGCRTRPTSASLIKSGAICLFGLFGCVTGTTVALKSIANALQSPEACAI